MPTHSRLLILRAAATCVGLALAAVGCDSTPKAATDPVVIPADDTPEPTFDPLARADAAEILSRYNARVSRMERLWARITAIVDGRDAEGSPLKEQAEGHLQLERPGSAALSLGKVGDTRLYLGCNDTVYWWIDTIDQSNRIAVEGDLDKVTDEKLAALGVPVRPADLADLLAARPLPFDSTAVLAGSTPGSVILAANRPSGARVLVEAMIDRLEPMSVTLIDARGAVARAELSGYEPFIVNDDRGVRTRVATDVRLIARVFEGSIRIALYEPQNREIKPIAFNPKRLYRAFRVDRVLDLDDPEVFSPAAQAGVAE